MSAAPAPTQGWTALLRADWTRFLFVHYALPAADLAPHTPLELDCRDGKAFVSLVCFRFERVRPATWIPTPLGRWLMRPVSDHWFLNLRTYVRGPAGPGIQFLIEWMDNPVGLYLGPWLYGLPYTRGIFERPPTAGDEALVRVTDGATRDALEIGYRETRDAEQTAPGDSLDEFLLEKYTAYTCRRGVTRFFHIAHPPWQWRRPILGKIDDTMIRRRCPWLARAEIVAAHTSVGFREVAMGYPQAVRAGNTLGNLCPASN